MLLSRTWVSAALAVILVIGGEQSVVRSQSARPAAASATSLMDPIGSFAPMLSRVIPAVVTILVIGEADVPVDLPSRSDGVSDLPMPMPRKQRFRSGGSGVIIDPLKGYILTNNHVIDNAISMEVVLSDGRRMSGTLVGRDIGADVAVVRVAPDDLPSLEIGDSDNVRVGDVVAAVGNPFGLEGTATLGIVSALMRSEVGHGAFEDFMQIDALVNPGNSGGALVDVKGRLVGINTAVAGGEGSNTGIGFAIPVRMARRIAAELIEHGQMRRGSPGLIVGNLDMAAMAAIGTKINRGALIEKVVANSPAAKAGIRPGGIVVQTGGKAVRGAADFNAQIGGLPVGTTISLVIHSAGREQAHTLALADLVIAPEAHELSAATGGLAGAVVGDILLGNPNFGDVRGAQVLHVPNDTPAYRTGLSPGDILIAVDSSAIRSAEQLLRAATRTGMLYRVKIIRDGKPGILRVTH